MSDSLYERCRALLMNRDVEELVLVVQTDEFLYTGLPADRFTGIIPIEGELVSWLDHVTHLSRDRVNDLISLISVPDKQCQ